MADTVERSFHDRELQKCKTENEAKIKAFETQLKDFRTDLADALSELGRNKADFISDVDDKIIKKLFSLEKIIELNLNACSRINSLIKEETLSEEEYAKITARNFPVPP